MSDLNGGRQPEEVTRANRECVALHTAETLSGESLMSVRTAATILALGVLAIGGISRVHAAELDVTFTVPVQIQNIRGDWSKVTVYCQGTRSGAGPAGNATPQKVGEIDVSGKVRGSISQTVTGTVKVAEDATTWVCELRVQRQGQDIETRFRADEVKSVQGVRVSGAF